MNLGIVAVRYAKALLGYAQEKEVGREVYDYMKILSGSYLHSPALRGAVENRILSIAQRCNLLWTACGGNPGTVNDPAVNVPYQVLANFFELILRHNRGVLVQSVALQYIDLYRKANGIIYGMLVTPMAVDKATADHAAALLQRSHPIENGTVELEFAEDPELLGGFRLETDREVLDASVAAALQRTRRALHIENKK